jgi:hypothetical protein
MTIKLLCCCDSVPSASDNQDLIAAISSKPCAICPRGLLDVSFCAQSLHIFLSSKKIAHKLMRRVQFPRLVVSKFIALGTILFLHRIK